MWQKKEGKIMYRFCDKSCATIKKQPRLKSKIKEVNHEAVI